MAATVAIWFFVTTTPPEKNGRDMGFSPKGSVYVKEPPVLNLMSNDLQNGGYNVIRKTRVYTHNVVFTLIKNPIWPL